MSKKSKQNKQKQREKRLRKERNVRRNQPTRESETAESDGDAPTVHRMDPERMLRAMARTKTSDDVETLEELQARIERFTGRNAAEIAREALALGGVEAAQELAYQALEAPSVPRALALAAKAVELDPQCCDALTMLALGRHDEPAQIIEALEHSVRCGAARLGPERFLGEDRGHFGGIVETRPYLRARSQLYTVLLRTDRRDQALEHGRELIALDSGDRQGVRWSLLGLLLEFDRLDEARALREQFAEDESGQFAWGEVLEEFLRGGPRGAAPALARARRVQPLFEFALFGSTALPDDPDVGETFVDLGKAWITHGSAFEWLQSGAPLSTPEEREAVCASFAPPVAELFALGEPMFGPEWPHYVAAHGFTLEHVPELLRLLDAREFDELNGDDARVWAPIHAARALGQLRAEQAIEPLIDFARRHQGDDYLVLEHIMEDIGLPAVDALVRWLRLPAATDDEHMTPIEALERIALANPSEHARITSELAALLLHFDRRPANLNSLLCDALYSLDATAYRSLVAQVLDSGRFDPEFVDDLEAVESWASSELSGA
jgi:tetratricopeptide (TPR) repeat protein